MERKVIIGTLVEGDVFHYYRKVDGTRKSIGPYVIIGQSGDMIIAKRTLGKENFLEEQKFMLTWGLQRGIDTCLMSRNCGLLWNYSKPSKESDIIPCFAICDQLV